MIEAHYTTGKQPTLDICKNVGGRREWILIGIKVGGRREALAVAEAHNATPWNFGPSHCRAKTIPAFEIAHDAAIDRHNNAALAALRGQPCPGEDEDSVAGYAQGLNERKVLVVVPRKPEGYYHAAVGTFG